MKVWQVTISDAEGIQETLICATKEIAEREMFKKREEILKSYKRMRKEVGGEFIEGNIKALSTNDYKKWYKNYPLETPRMDEIEVLSK